MRPGVTMESMTEETTGKRPTRSRHHKVVGGVCGGLGRHYGIDPVVFRVPLAVISVLGGMGLIVYGVAWLLIPFEDEEENEGRRLLSGRVEGPGLTALLLVLVGCGLMLASLGDQDGEATGFSLMVLAALAGAAYWSRHRGEAARAAESGTARVDAVTAQAVADAPPEAQPPPAPAGPSWWRGPAADGAGASAAERASGYLWGPAHARPGGQTAPAGPGGPQGGPAWSGPAGPAAAAARPVPRERRLGGLLLLLAMAACVLGTGAAWRNDSLGDAAVTGLACALGVFGAGLVVSAFWGRVGAGTIVSAVLTAGLLTLAAALPEGITTSWSEPDWRPASAAAVRDHYEVGSGLAHLDLSGIDVPQGETVATHVEAGAGQIEVVVPPEVELTVTTEIALGGFYYDGRPPGQDTGTTEAWGGLVQEHTDTYPPLDGAGEPGGTIELRLEMGLGQVTVERAEVRP